MIYDILILPFPFLLFLPYNISLIDFKCKFGGEGSASVSMKRSCSHSGFSVQTCNIIINIIIWNNICFRNDKHLPHPWLRSILIPNRYILHKWCQIMVSSQTPGIIVKSLLASRWIFGWWTTYHSRNLMVQQRELPWQNCATHSLLQIIPLLIAISLQMLFCFYSVWTSSILLPPDWQLLLLSLKHWGKPVTGV